MFTSCLYLYIKINENKITARNLKTGQEATRISSPEFSSPRLLVADFTQASQVMKGAVKEISPLLSLRKKVIVHPLEKNEGGFGEIELRIFRELVLGACGSWETFLEEAICTRDNALGEREIYAHWADGRAGDHFVSRK